MTKEEMRETAICKMHLTPDAVVYDVGSGTGSIAVEMARLSENLAVYAIERKPEAVTLIKKNCAKYGLSNVKEPELIDSYIYELNAAHLRYQVILRDYKLLKEQKIT